MVLQEGSAGWQWAATPAEARRRYLDVVESNTEFAPEKATRIQLFEMGQVVEETTLGRERN